METADRRYSGGKAQRAAAMSLSTVSLERRSNSVINLKRMDLSDSPVSGEDMESAFNPICPRVTHGGFDRHGPRRTGFAVWLIALVLGSLTMLLSVMVFNTAKMGFRSISTTSYVNVNYWPSVANNNGVHDVWPERQSRNSALADIGPKHLRLHLGPGYKNQASKSLSDTALNMPRNDAESWPPETPNWELCSSRSDPQTIRTSGSVFGYFSMYLRCPAAPSFQPVLYFDPPKRTKKPAGPNANGTSPELLIGVFSGCLSRLRRDTVRETWGR